MQLGHCLDQGKAQPGTGLGSAGVEADKSFGDRLLLIFRDAWLKNGILNVMIEVRNDLLETHSQCTKVAALLTAWLSEALEICRSGTPSLEAKA